MVASFYRHAAPTGPVRWTGFDADVLQTCGPYGAGAMDGFDANVLQTCGPYGASAMDRLCCEITLPISPRRGDQLISNIRLIGTNAFSATRGSNTISGARFFMQR